MILEHHPDFQGQWIVQSLVPGWFFDFSDLIGPYRALSPAKLNQFLTLAKDFNYKVAFGEDPQNILEAYDGLNEEPAVTLNSTLPGTVNGMLPYQVQGFNFLKDLAGGVAMWSTGTGKTVLASALLKYHTDMLDFDLAFVVVKSHNKINTQRTLLGLSGVESTILDGPQKRRQETLLALAKAPVGTVVVTNYEKFRIDNAHLKPLFEKRILIIWDEMPTKLKNRTTQIYKSARSLLYRKVDLTDQRPESLRQYMLSATPIENNPEDWFNCVRLLDPSVYGSIADFHDEYVAGWSYFGHNPETWQNLDKMGLKAAHITHQVDKNDPDIAAQFPDVIETPYYIDWDRKDRVIYDMLANEAKKSLEDRVNFEDDGILGMISVMQMMCDAPSMVSNSAALRAAYEDAVEDYYYGKPPTKEGSEVARKLQELLTRKLDNDSHTKIEVLRQLILEDHPVDKVIVFSSFNEALLPILEGYMKQWKVKYVRYEGSSKQKQAAQDAFTNDPSIRVFLSSDQGSDSLSLEAASVVIHYDLPWKYSTYIQRQNRAHRVTSTHDHVRYYTLMMENSVEDRKLKIIKKKQAYHEQVFKGAIAEQAESARMSREDLLYILGG